MSTVKHSLASNGISFAFFVLYCCKMLKAVRDNCGGWQRGHREALSQGDVNGDHNKCRESYVSNKSLLSIKARDEKLNLLPEKVIFSYFTK